MVSSTNLETSAIADTQAAPLDAAAHWEAIHRARRADEVGWFQAEPTVSLDLIRRAAPDPVAPIVDVGSGRSLLVDALLIAGYEDVTVLDISERALAEVRQRLAILASCVGWIHADVLSADLPESAFDVWHDRAVFHFLTAADDRAAYIAQVRRAVRPGGHVIIATFADDGPHSCSGLPVVRYSADSLAGELGPSFELVESIREQHVTPSGSRQSFVYGLFRLVAD